MEKEKLASFKQQLTELETKVNIEELTKEKMIEINDSIIKLNKDIEFETKTGMQASNNLDQPKKANSLIIILIVLGTTTVLVASSLVVIKIFKRNR